MKVKIKKNVLRLTLNGADTQGDSFSELSMQLQHLGIMCYNVVPEKNKTTFEYNIEGLYSLHLLSKQAEYAMVNAVCEQLLLLERACLDLGLPRDRFLLSEKFSFMDANGQLKVVYLPVDERAECSCPLDFAYSFLNSNSKKLNPDALDYLNGRLSSVAAELSGTAFVQAEELAKPAELISDGAEDSSYFVDCSSVMCPVSETDIQDLLSYSEAFSSEQAQEPSYAIDEPTVGFAQAPAPVQPSVPVTCCLVRYYNSEIINIAKPVFTLGTARDCDYCVSDNRKISKHHGQIIWFAPEGRFCFIDCGSTNKSSINGETLVPGERYALESGAKIVMADEIFNFYM